jgi:hypothetical protein
MMEGILAGKVPVTGLLPSVADLRRAGHQVLPGSPHPVPHGISLHHELELMVRAGFCPVDVLRSATVLPARAFGLIDRGAVEPGLRADVVLIDGDPTTDITATRNIRAVSRARAAPSMRCRVAADRVLAYVAAFPGTAATQDVRAQDMP